MDLLTLIAMLGAVATVLNSIAEIIKAISHLVDSIKRPTAPKKRKPNRRNGNGKR